MKALVTGAGGQDGTLLSRLLRSQQVDVIVSPDVTDATAMERVIRDSQPDRIFHLAACHHSSERTNDSELQERMVATNFRSTETLVRAVERCAPACRLLFAGTSQMYTPPEAGRRLVSEETPIEPASYYGWTKAWSRELLTYYRMDRGLYCLTVILFNHESPLRRPEFVTRKITMAAARAARGDKTNLELSNVDAHVDWSSAEDVVDGMVLALMAPQPDDYVIASGVTHTVSDVLDVAFRRVGLEWSKYVAGGASRPRGALLGDSSRIRRNLGWKPRVSFESLIEAMVDEDRRLLQ